ncbi:TonB-dependent receptor [Flavobacterium ardleyense]|uniref:TonB-dependent receptor n=1 Tax=Flavobacterium ardleyense TaxID=2038737 RepID=A0ABW5Z6F7_9FLAO
MKIFKNVLFYGFLLLSSLTVFSQSKITGVVIDEELNQPLAGASVLVKGTTTGSVTDFDGKFEISSALKVGEIVISYLGFETKTVKFTVSGSSIDLGRVTLFPDANQLQEVVLVGQGVLDIAKDRKTPVAVSTIKAAEIQEKLGNQEFPEMLANTPSVYVTKSGGGFGDSRINIRGFDQKNIAVMINGVPVNDMENSSVYWSNWAGLSDVTSAMQVQRGLGSSKLAISSVGGTVNVVTRSADMKQGGAVSAGVANDDYLKTQVSYSTGKMKNGLSTSILFSQTRGDGYVDGTKFEGGNYFIALGYAINEKHDVQLTFTGAPQWHNQRSNAPTIAQYIKYGGGVEPNVRYNSDWGYADGKEFSMRTNYYHKPVMSLNWDFKINETTKLSSVFYGSWGRGAGTLGAGGIRGNRYDSDNLRTADGLVDIDLIQAYNSGETVLINGIPQTRTQTGGFYQNTSSTSNNATTGISKIAQINSHNWYGGVINLNKKLNDKVTIDFGVDARTYRGIHYNTLTDLMGADNFYDNSNINNPGNVVSYEYTARPHLNPFFSLDYQKEKINYNNDGLVNWYGAFTQLEYAGENLTAFVQGALSNQGYRRDDFFKYLESDPLYSTDYENLLGGNIKGGANYNIDDNHNIFANAGYYSKQPFFNAVYPNNASVLNENLTNEKIIGVELGYGFRSRTFNANVNLYRTSWNDRFIRLSTEIDDDLNIATPTVRGTAFLQGVEQIHTGVEVDFNYKPFQKLQINGMVSVGDWKYGSSVTANYQDDNNVVVTNPSGTPFTETLYIKDVKVGDAAQTTAAIGATYEILERFKIDGNYRYVDNLFASIDPTSFKNQAANDKGSLQLPGYGLLDAGISYKMLVGKDKMNSVNLRLNVNNVLDELYIAESRTNIHTKTQADFVLPVGDPNAGQPNVAAYQTYQNTQVYDGLDKSNRVYLGFGRTWNFTIRYNF